MTASPKAQPELSSPATDAPGPARTSLSLRDVDSTAAAHVPLPPEQRRSTTQALPSESPPGPASRPHLVPDVLVAGVTHSGVRRFCADLARHPDISVPVAPRIDHYTSLRFGVSPRTVLEDYDRDFATWHGERYRVEISPVYFDGGPQLVRQVAQELPHLRVLVLLGDPTQRLLSSYRDKHRRRRLPESMSFEGYVNRSLALRANGSDLFEGNRYFRTLSGGVYVDHLWHWWDSFGDRVLVEFPEASCAGAFARVGDWLGLDLGSAEGRCRDGTLVDPGQLRSQWLETFEIDPDDADVRGEPASSGRSGWGWVDRARRRTIGDRRSDERALRMVEAFYRPSNRLLAAELRARGQVHLPQWLVQA